MRLGVRVFGAILFFFASRRRHTRCLSDWSSDVCSSDLPAHVDPLEMYWDRDARSKNLIDMRRVWRVRRMQLDEARSFVQSRSEERRVGKECRSRWAPAYQTQEE